MNTLLLEHFAAVSKIAAFQQAKRRQVAANFSAGGYYSNVHELLTLPFSVQCVFKPMVLTDDIQVVFAMSGSATAPRIDLHGYITAYLGGKGVRINDIVVDTVYDFVFVCDSDKSILYVDGTLAASFADVSRCTGYRLGYLLDNYTQYHFQGDYLLHRHFNYAMSANEVKALDNTGDPAGYVLPAELKNGDQRCIAEYLPQNLVADNNGLVSSWLDSAKQLPMNDEYIPPLLETAGGYDLTAEGTPKIIYKL